MYKKKNAYKTYVLNNQLYTINCKSLLNDGEYIIISFFLFQISIFKILNERIIKDRRTLTH